MKKMIIKTLCDIGNERMRNICSKGESVVGDVDEVFKECDVILERDYHTKANAQGMMETFALMPILILMIV